MGRVRGVVGWAWAGGGDGDAFRWAGLIMGAGLRASVGRSSLGQWIVLMQWGLGWGWACNGGRCWGVLCWAESGWGFECGWGRALLGLEWRLGFDVICIGLSLGCVACAGAGLGMVAGLLWAWSGAGLYLAWVETGHALLVGLLGWSSLGFWRSAVNVTGAGLSSRDWIGCWGQGPCLLGLGFFRLGLGAGNLIGAGLC
ncbi:hypothetical protein FNV43_RR20651 [Rhamnella rubrinervis]|uniref:Uncharacterized protein n=1 Tax=Rhamnella rubrinervis TaxID=2594499 RepID=A0A8K0E1U1_9ROSA|nr:hypothetical protein FNV43_RR20651 [Rhamnella rubrinervis]